jgi:diketogulonate reductase-like aldo/keto reductase
MSFQIKPSINQIEFHPYVYASLAPLLALHKEHDIHLAAYGPLTPIFRVQGGAVEAVVTDLAKKKGVADGGQVLLKWALQKGQGEVIT